MNGLYKSLFRAWSRSESRGSSGKASAAAIAAPERHVLTEAAWSCEVQALISVASAGSPSPYAPAYRRY